MASKTQKIKRIRKRKKSKQGKNRKRHIKKYGSTPSFPIHPENSTLEEKIFNRESSDGEASSSKEILPEVKELPEGEGSTSKEIQAQGEDSSKTQGEKKEG